MSDWPLVTERQVGSLHLGPSYWMMLERFAFVLCTLCSATAALVNVAVGKLSCISLTIDGLSIQRPSKCTVGIYGSKRDGLPFSEILSVWPTLNHCLTPC